MTTRSLAEKLRSLKEQDIPLIKDDVQERERLQRFREEIIDLKRQIDDASQELSSYDLEHYTKNIRALLKTVTSQIQQIDKSSDPKRKFQFQRKPRRFANTSISQDLDVTSSTVQIENKDIEIIQNISILQNLKICKVYTTKQEKNAVSGSIALSHVDDSFIKLDNIPFDTGNVFITDCSNCIIIIKVPAEDKIQLRLHNLFRCKIHIGPVDGTPSHLQQMVIIEGLQECTFDINSEPQILIRNFSQLNDNSKDSNAYIFANIDIGIDQTTI